mgnify:FL=1
MASTQDPVGEPRLVFDSNEPVRPPAGFDWGFAEGVKVTEKKYAKLLSIAQKAWGYLFRTATKEQAEAHAIRAELMQVFGELEALCDLGEKP